MNHLSLLPLNRNNREILKLPEIGLVVDQHGQYIVGLKLNIYFYMIFIYIIYHLYNIPKYKKNAMTIWPTLYITEGNNI